MKIEASNLPNFDKNTLDKADFDSPQGTFAPRNILVDKFREKNLDLGFRPQKNHSPFHGRFHIPQNSGTLMSCQNLDGSPHTPKSHLKGSMPTNLSLDSAVNFESTNLDLLKPMEGQNDTEIGAIDSMAHISVKTPDLRSPCNETARATTKVSNLKVD